ncbi:MAG: hypothetical protein OHK0032_01260 [Thermodesulfovibrionales bacterium]
MKRILAFSLGVVMLVSALACKKKEQKPVPQAQQTPFVHGMPVSKGETRVIIPESVKGRWAAVKIVVEDKSTKKTQEFTVNLNSEFKIPNSDLKVSVGEFLPDFKMDVGSITTASNEPNNPAVGIRVLEGDKQIFPEPGRQWGWLYSKFPTIHPFEHPGFGLTLKEGIKRG